MTKRIVIAAGGTGGHFYPGLVLAKTLRDRSWQPLMLVRRREPARAALEKEGVAACEIDLSGLPRSLTPRLAGFAWKLLKSLGLLKRILSDFHPQAVVGMGGYLSFPAVASAARLRLPRAIHESNAALGLANRLCLPLGARLFRGLPPAPGEPSGVLTGTPIRPALWQVAEAHVSRTRLGLEAFRGTVLVFGGSQGARGLNTLAPRALAAAAKASPGSLQVLHLAGAKEAQAVRAAYAGAPLKAVVLPYLEEMEQAYAAADLVVCRAGASTLAELCAQRKPAVLVPYPNAAAAHQEANARLFERLGAARVILERDLEEFLAPTLADLLSSGQGASLRSDMAESYAKLGLPAPERAAAQLADAVEEFART